MCHHIQRSVRDSLGSAWHNTAPPWISKGVTCPEAFFWYNTWMKAGWMTKRERVGKHLRNTVRLMTDQPTTIENIRRQMNRSGRLATFLSTVLISQHPLIFTQTHSGERTAVSHIIRIHKKALHWGHHRGKLLVVTSYRHIQNFCRRL